MRPSGRAPDQMRTIEMIPGFSAHAEGSCLVKFGNTHVLVTASVEDMREQQSFRPQQFSLKSKQPYCNQFKSLMPQNKVCLVTVGLLTDSEHF